MIKDVKPNYENRESFYRRGNGTIVVNYTCNGGYGDEKEAISIACEILSQQDYNGPSIRHQIGCLPQTHKKYLPNGEVKCETRFEGEVCSKQK